MKTTVGGRRTVRPGRAGWKAKTQSTTSWRPLRWRIWSREPGDAGLTTRSELETTMSAVFEDIVAAVGYTPLVRLNKLGSGRAQILAKLESKNPCGSVKDRIAKYMIETAEEQGRIKPGATVLVEPTSGNTGIG